MKSKWISTKEEVKPNLLARFKKSLTLDEIKNTIIDISADDYYKLYVNGKYVGQGPAPSYSFDYAYNRFDITDYLVVGENIIEALVYYQGLVNRVWVSGDNKYGLVADIYIDNTFAFGTDSAWQYQTIYSILAGDTVGYDTAFLENRDFRIDDSEFKNAVEIDADYAFEAEPFPALEVYSKRVEPIINGNKYFYDFNEEYVGNLKITATGNGKIIIRCAEELENGELKFDMRCGCKYEEEIILNGEEITFEQFDYKAFRYVEIETIDAELIDLELSIRHFPFNQAWNFETDSDDLKAVFELCKNTIKYGTQESFIDCPTREKGQYLGDAFISGFAHFYLTNDERLLKRAISSFSNSIIYSNKILAVSSCAYEQEIADYSLLFPVMVWKYYSYTNDKEFLKSMLSACEFIINYFAKFENDNSLLENANEQWNLVDWPENLRDNYEFSDVHNVINAFYYASVKAYEEIKAELGFSNDNKAEKIKESYNKVFLKNGLYVDSINSSHSSIHSNMLPLAFGISNDTAIADYLINRSIQCGTYMSYFYLKALCNTGKKDEAVKAIKSKGEYSWFNMLSEGATRTYEAWGKEKKWNTSLFHPWSTAPILILYEDFDV